MTLTHARYAGLLYLLLVIAAPFRLIYIPNELFVTGDAAATVANIAGHSMMFKLGMLSDLFCGALEIFLVFALYRVFRHVHPRYAVLMVLLSLPTGAINFLNILNDGAALMLAGGTDFLSAFSQPQREALAMLFLRLHDLEVLAVGLFWGLWLFPLAALIIRSGMLPRVLGYWLVANGIAYLVISVTGMFLPEHAATVGMFALPAQLGEVAFMLWMLIMGVSGERGEGASQARGQALPAAAGAV